MFIVALKSCPLATPSIPVENNAGIVNKSSTLSVSGSVTVTTCLPAP